MDNQNTQANLFTICYTPDLRIHSKHGLFSNIVKEQPFELKKIKEDIIKLSYSMKSVGIQNGEIGVFTQRLPLRLKQKLISEKKPTEQTNFTRHFIPHNSFLSNPLHTIRKERISTREQEPGNFNPEFSTTNYQTENRRTFRSVTKVIKQKSQKPKSKSQEKPAASNPNSRKSTKSYSRLLNELENKKIIKLEPMQSDNRMLEQIKKISNLTQIQTSNKISKIAYLKNL